MEIVCCFYLFYTIAEPLSFGLITGQNLCTIMKSTHFCSHRFSLCCVNAVVCACVCVCVQVCSDSVCVSVESETTC